MKAWIKKLLNRYGWFQLHELVVGGHCGLCGAWISDKVFPEYYRWGICDKCARESEE